MSTTQSSIKKPSSRTGATPLSSMNPEQLWQYFCSTNPSHAAVQYYNRVNNSTIGLRGEASIASVEGSLPSITVRSSGLVGGRPKQPRNDGMPCSEKEMKALMSMFVEIMGLQINTDRLNQTSETLKPSSSSKASKKKPSSSFTSSVVMPVFRFPSNVPPPPLGWPDSLFWPPTDDLTPDAAAMTDSVPLLEPIPPNERAQMIRNCQEAMRKSRRQCKPYQPFPPVPGTTAEGVPKATDPVTGIEGIVPPEWQTLVRAAIEDALEQEELLGIRLRKHEKESSSKKSNSKSGLVPQPRPTMQHILSSRSVTSNEAASALQKVEDANRKLTKAVGMWRSRVMAAVGQNEVSKLELLLAESPLRTVTQMQQQAATVLNFHNQNLLHFHPNRAQVESVEDHLKQLVPLTILAKLGAPNGGVESRLLLALYICQEFTVQYFLVPGRTGRTALHTACMMGDLPLLQLILDKMVEQLEPPVVYEVILHYCQDSGWTSLHYAVSSGSLRVVQCILQGLSVGSSSAEQCDMQMAIQCISNDALSWKKGDPQQGITVQHLAVALMSHEPEAMIETHGMALQEIVNFRLRGNKSSVDPTVYVTMLSQITIHLILIQSLGYTPLSEEDILRVEQETPQYMEKCRNGSQSTTAALTDPARENVPVPWIDSDDETSPMTKAEGKKKRKRKKKIKKNDAATASVASSSNGVGSSAVAVSPSKDDVSVDDESELSKPSTPTDPLVAALLGMGFEHANIMDGINACGGMSRATADNVVAWIVGGGMTTITPEPLTVPQTNLLPPTSTAKLEPPPSSISATKSIARQSELEKRNLEVVRQKEEERLKAEKLAAKREEQRRLNREWNTRNQARQIQEIQEKMTKSIQAKPQVPGGVGIMRSVSAGSNVAFSGPSSISGRVPSPTSGMGTSGHDASAATPSRMVPSTTTRSRLNLGPSASESRIGDNADGSTIASSVDHGIIEICGNDDATVSTIGSFPAVYPTQAPPPGFSNGPLLSNSNALEGPMARFNTQAQWEAHRSMLPSESYPPVNNHQMSFARMGLGPIIPETGPLPNFHGNFYSGMPSHPLNHSSHSSGIPSTTMGSFSGMEQDFGNSGSANLFPGGSPTRAANDQCTNFVGDAVFGASLPSTGYPSPTPSLPSNRMDRSISAPTHLSSSFVNGPSSPSLPGFFGFGPDPNQNAIDASIIDSISTGNTGVAGSALWGTPNARNEDGGSSLLRNLINTTSNTDYPQETSMYPATNETDDALYPSAPVYHSNDGMSWEMEQLSKLRASQQGTIGPSIW